MMNSNDLLDFELEDPLLCSPVAPKKRKNVIKLDDLLTEHYKEQNRSIQKEAKKRATAQKSSCHSDEEEERKEALLSNIVDGCHKQMNEISTEEEIYEWGIRVFGKQKTAPPLVIPDPGSCSLMQSFMNNQLNSVVGLTIEKGCSFLEGLLMNGWLSSLVFKCGCLEKSISTWTFNLLLYSPKEELRSSACDFWCAIFSAKNEVGALPIKIDWFPSYNDLRSALEIYGFVFNFSPNTVSVSVGSDLEGPPQNIRTWIRFSAACCQVRSKYSIVQPSEAEELVETVICLFLDRQIQSLSLLMRNCLLSAISYFADGEWNASCKNIAWALAGRLPRDLNCLRIVECISGVNTRSKHLRSAVAFQILVNCFDNKATDDEGILRLLISSNMKDKHHDLFLMYIYLVLAENWLLYGPMLEDKPVIREMWVLYLRQWFCQISSTDFRSYATKIRNKAAFLLQGTDNK